MALFVVILGTICAGVSSALSKKLATLHEDKLIGLVYQYCSVVVFACVLHGAFVVYDGQAFLPNLSWVQRGWIVMTGVIGYGGIYALFRSFHTTSAGVALIVANLSTFIMYVVNLVLLGQQEAISLMKIVLAVVFFIIVSGLLLAEDSLGIRRLKINSGIVFALMTAICRTWYFSANTYFIKMHWLTPSQSLLVTESGVALSAFVVYMCRYGKQSFAVLRRGWHPQYLWWIGGVGLFLMLSILAMYYGYASLPASVVNVVKLFSIVITAGCCRWWFGEKLNKKELVLMGMALVVLVAFVIV